MLLASGMGGCSTYMEATRPDPVDLDRFKPGEARIDVVGQIGAPTSSVKDQDKSCDVYQLYIHGPGAWGKAGIAFGEAAADVFTLGLAEAVTTPAEALTRNKLHTVLFCYGGDDKLALVQASDSDKAPPDTATSQPPVAAPASTASPAPVAPPAAAAPAKPGN
jgi:hypothetical protein